MKEAVKRYFRWKVNLFCNLYVVRQVICEGWYFICYMWGLVFYMLYVRVGILLTRGQNLHDRIISIREEVWVHNTSLTPQLCIEVRVPIQDKERSYTSVLGSRFCLFLGFWYLILKLLRQCWMRFAMYYIFRYKWHVHQHRSWGKKAM